MNRVIIFSITEAENSILEFLRNKGVSSRLISHLKKQADTVTVNEKPVFITYPLKAGDLLKLCFLEKDFPQKIKPVNLPFFIVYEDEDILIVNKPAGMSVHPSLNHYENTLANALAYYYQQKGEKNFVFRAINRLDRDTTGLLLAAKNPFSAALLYRMAKERKLVRKYIAMADGILPPVGTVDAPIGRAEGSILARRVDFENGLPAVTHFRRLSIGKGFSKAEFILETGRTHQIRVHMQYIGHPLLGDFLYAPMDTRLSRQALHASVLEFYHPVTGEYMCFSAPLPEDMLLLENRKS